MSRKSVIRPYKMFNAVDVSSDQTSGWTNVEFVDLGSIIVEWAKASANPVGNFIVQGQNGDSAIIDLSTTAISSASGSAQIAINPFNVEKIRVFWDRTSGDGAMTATLCAKVLGA